MTQVWTITYTAVCRPSSCFEQQVAIFRPVVGVPKLFFQVSQRKDFRTYARSYLIFKFVGSEKISRIWKTWITGNHGFLHEAVGLFVTRLNREIFIIYVYPDIQEIE